MGVLAKSPGKYGRAALAAVLALLALCAPAAAQQRAVPESAVAMKQSFAPVVKRAAPAVVNVYVRHRVEQMVSPFFDDPFFGRLFGERFGIPRERIQNSLGSGVLVSPEGVVVTNNHVIQGSGDTEITVALTDGREFPAKVILKDEQTDLAVLRLDAGGVQFSSIEFSDSDSLEVGDLVLAIGDPFGVGQTVTSGIVSALARTQVGISDYQFFIQTDAAINPGNSGGALVDMDGRLVGINTAIFSKSGGSHGIGFAIPSNMVRLVVQSALKGGKVQRPWLGAALQTGDAGHRRVARARDAVRRAGRQGSRQGPRGQGGLESRRRRGQRRRQAGAEPASLPIPLRHQGHRRRGRARRVAQGATGQGHHHADRPGRGPAARCARSRRPPSADRLQGRQSSRPRSRRRSASTTTCATGVVVLDVKDKTPAARLGVKRGDIVVGINNEKVKSVAQLVAALDAADGGWRLSVERGGKVFNLAIQG